MLTYSLGLLFMVTTGKGWYLMGIPTKTFENGPNDIRQHRITEGS